MNKQKLNKKNIIAYLLFILIFIIILFFIFYDGSASSSTPEGMTSLNTELPSPVESELSDNKIKIYRDQDIQDNRHMRSMNEYVASLIVNDNLSSAEPSKQEYIDPGIASLKSELQNLDRAQRENVRTHTGGSSYSSRERERLESSQELEQRIQMIERTYQAASRIANSENTSTAVDTKTQQDDEHYNHVSKVDNSTISSLDASAQGGFYDITSSPGVDILKNTIKAVVSANQSVENGQRIFLRLVEPLVVSGITIPRGHLLAGVVTIAKERLRVDVRSIEYQGSIYPVRITVYDTDGLEGLYCPIGSGTTASRELASNVASGVASGMSISTNATSQITQGVTRGLFSTAGSTLQRGARKIKVHLPENYEVLLLPKNK